MTETSPETPQTPKPHHPVPPHTPLREYYEADEKRHPYVIDLFNRTARFYNTIEGIFLNGGLLYRRLSLQINGLKPGMKVLDVAIGTGAVARGATRIVGPTGQVIGCDPSPGMIKEARRHFQGPISRGIAEQLPFADDTFDFVTMGIALRHVADLSAAFSEYFRVLKPGGTCWILESHVPESKIGHDVTKFVWAKVIPGMTLLYTGSHDAKLLMDFYWDTVEKCLPPEQIVQVMRDVGFDARYKVVMPGAFCEYIGKKPA
ncbi:MAG TPA: class I SAM-dependent methyltransferase [Candidatus Binatia bacterium]|nr:class I SAM-dependent methyltransferase [Candidatus Binatia bacterium]